MTKGFRRLAAAGLFSAVSAWPVCGHAAQITFNSQTFAIGASETITAMFNDVDGQKTSGSYSGLALITVSGQGNGAWGGTLNDAFYANIPYPGAPGGCGSLAMRTLALSGGCTRYAQRAMVYSVDDATFVSMSGGTYVPQYQATHQYQFVVSVDKLLAEEAQATPQSLWFGTTDGNYGDNGGFFTVTVAQLTAAATATLPAGGSFGLSLAALAALAGAHRRRGRLPG